MVLIRNFEDRAATKSICPAKQTLESIPAYLTNFPEAQSKLILPLA